MATEHQILESDVHEALSRVDDPEIGKPITELNICLLYTSDAADDSTEV